MSSSTKQQVNSVHFTFNDSLDNSMIVMTCDELRVKCESDIFKDDSSVSRLLRMSAMKLHALFRRIPVRWPTA